MKKSLSKRVTEILFLTSIGVIGCSTMPSVVYAQNNNDIAIIAKHSEVKSTPKIDKIKYGDFYGEVSYRFNCEDTNYTNNVTDINVNGVKYDDKNLEFSKHYYGLRVIPRAFKDGENVIKIKANGYKDKVIKISKDGTILSEEDVKDKDEKLSKENKADININADIKVEAGSPINLMEGVWAKDEDGNDISNTIKATCENLKVDNPIEGKYKAIYSIKNKDGQIKTAERNIIVSKKRDESDKLNKNKLEDGLYTLGFKAYKLDSDNKETSMLGGFFDKNVKLEVKEGKMTVTMLNIVQATMLYDFRMISNGIAAESICNGYGEANNKGIYEKQTFQFPISDITSDHVAGVLVSAMGGKKTDVGDMSKYKQVNIVFDKDVKKGWTGFEEGLKDNKILDDKFEAVALNFDKDGDGKVSNSEYKAAQGGLNFKLENLSDMRKYAKIKDISKLKNFGAGIKYIDLTSHAVSELPKGVFDNLTNLERLNINCNKIKSLPKRIFDKLTNLKELNLNENQIEELPEGIFDNLTKLETLTMNRNRFKRLPENIFNNLKSLDFLTLDENMIENIPTGIKNLKNLTWLSMDKNNITTIPKELGELKNLSRVTLSNNNIKTIANEFYNNGKNIQYLDLTNNLLSDIPKDLENKLSNAYNLDFSINKIDNIPANIKNIVQTSETRTNKLKLYPQKSTMNLTVKAEDGKINWKEDLSSLDFMYWSMYLSEEAQTVEQYKNLLNKKLEEAKKSPDKSNFKSVLDLLSDKGVDWFIVTEIQKKNNDGKYVTIKKIENLGKLDPMENSWKDSNMEQGNEYRIIKKAFNIKSNDSYMIIFSDEAECKATKVDVKPIKDDAIILKDIEVDILKENNNELSMAGTYVKKVQYEVKDGKKYIRLNINRSDWMKNIKIIVDGNEVNPEILKVEKNNDNQENSEIRFEVKGIDSKIKVNMNVIPMNNNLVSFRIVPKKSSLDLIDTENKKSEVKNKDEKPVENTAVVPVMDNLAVVNSKEEAENLNTLKPSKENIDMIKEIKVKTLKENEEIPSMAGKYLEKVSYEIKDGYKYIRVVLNKSHWMKNVKAIVDGKEVNAEVLSIIKNKNGEEKTEFRFTVKDINSKLKLKMNVVPMNNSLVTFRLVPEEEVLKNIINEKKCDKKELQSEEKLLKLNNNEEIKNNLMENKNHLTNEETNISKENHMNKSVLPRTGSPISVNVLGYLGALIGVVGILFKKKK